MQFIVVHRVRVRLTVILFVMILAIMVSLTLANAALADGPRSSASALPMPADPLAAYMPYEIALGDVSLLDNSDVAVGMSGDSTISKCETKTFVYSVQNQGTVPITSLVATAHLANLTGFEYVTGTASLDIDGAPFCSANPQISGTDLVWDIDAACGLTQTLEVGETLDISVDLETSCTAVSGSLNGTIAYQRGLTPVSDDTAVMSIEVLPGAVAIRKTPSFAPGAVGDIVTFRIEVENTGLGIISNVEVLDEINTGLSYPYASASGIVVGQNQTWTSTEIAALASMNPGDIVSWDVDVQVIACENLDTTADAKWGCNPVGVCYDTAVDGGTADAAVLRLARTPNLSYSPPDITFDYCDNSHPVTFTVYNIGDGPANQVRLYAGMTGFSVGNVSAGATYNAGQARFELEDPIPAGGSYQLSYELGRSNWCDEFDELKVLWQTEYLDSCDNQFYPPVHISKIKPPASRPSLSVGLSGVPGIIQFGESVTYTVESLYHGPETCGSGSVGPVTVTDTVPAGWTVSDSGGGVWTPGGGGTGGTVVWTYAPPASLATSLTLDPPDYSECETFCYTSFQNKLDASGEDCCGCILTESDTSTTYLECEEGVDSEKTASGPVERCDTVTYTNTYAFPGGSSLNLDDLRFTEMADRDQEFVTGTLSINLSGSGDITSCPTVTNTTVAGGELDIDFSGCAATPLAGQTLTIIYELEITPSTIGACDNGTIVSWSRMDLGSTAPGGCLQDGIVYEATTVPIWAPEMEVTVTGVSDVMALCEPATITVTLRRTSALAQPRDVVLELSGLNYYVVNPAAVNCLGPITPVSCLPSLVGDDYVWTFEDRFLANNDEAVLEIPVRKRCAGGGKLEATAYYDDNCNDDATADMICSATGSDTADLVVSGDLLIEVTPEQYLADTDQATWKVYVTNRGSGDAHSVWIDYAMGSGLVFDSVIPDNPTGVTTNANMDHQGSAINGGTTSIDLIEAGTRREFDVTANLVGCSDMTLQATTSFGCDGEDCDPPISDGSLVFVPDPLLVTTNVVGTPIDACDSTTGDVVFRNAGPVTDYDLQATIELPSGLTYVSGSTRWRVDDGAWNGPNVAYDPLDLTTSIVYSSTHIPSMAALASGSQIEIKYDLVANCSFTGGTVTVGTSYESPCGELKLAPDSRYLVVPVEPDIHVSVTKDSAPVGCTETVQWTVQVTNNSGFNLPFVQVKNIFGAAWTYDPSGPGWQGAYAESTWDYDGTDTVTWELTNLASGATAQLLINSQSDSSPCNADTDHDVEVRWGCGLVDGEPSTVPGVNETGCVNAIPFTDTASADREPELSFASVSLSPTSIDACANSTEVTLIIENTGPVDANDVDVRLVLPDGLSYINASSMMGQSNNEANALSALGGVGDPAQSGVNSEILTWYDIGSASSDLTNTLEASGGNNTIALRFDVSSECYEPGNLATTLYYYDCCRDSQYNASDSFEMAALYPQLTITKSPSAQQVDCGELVTWTLIVTNTGTGNAQIVAVEDTLGDWLDYVSSDPAATQLDGQTYGWELSDLGAASSETLTITARLNPDTSDDCAAALRRNNARAHWACGTADGNPSTTGEYSCTDDWVEAAATTVQMPNLGVHDINPTITCLADGTFTGTLQVQLQNQGDGDALSAFTVEVTDGKGWTGWITPTGQAAGTSAWYTMDTSAWLPDCHDCSSPYVISATVDTLDQVCECDETNNTRSENYSAPIPELAVDDIDFSQVVCSGDALGGVVRVVVSNAACSDASNVRVRLETDGCLTFSDQVIALVEDQSSATASFPVANWADCLSNTCVFTATVDPDGEVCECDGSNQQRVESWDAEQPDLVVTAVDTSGLTCGNDEVGGAITVTIRNDGYGPPANIPVRLNTDGCLTFGDQTVVGPLVNGATADVVFPVSGGWGDCADVSCALTAIVDPDDVICECDGANNELGAILSSGLPNLYIDTVTPEIVCDDDGLKTVSIAVVVGNEGASAANGVVVRLASTCGQTFVDQTVDLGVGATATLTYTASSTDAHCACDYTAVIDPDNAVCECSDSDNTVASGVYESPVTELYVADIDFSNVTCSSDGISGEVRVQVANAGCATASNVVVSLGTDGCLTLGNESIASVAAGGSSWSTFAISGDWTPCTNSSCDFTATVDPLNAICEFDGTNNARTETHDMTLPDLVVSAIDTTGIVCDDDSITGAVTVTVANQGHGAASNFQVALATDGCLTFGNETVLVSLANGQMTDVRFDVSGSWADCAAATCLFTATVDATDAVCECDGGNNTLSASHTSDTVDLVINSVTPDSGCVADVLTGTVTVNLANNGTIAAANALVRVTSDCGQSFDDQTVTMAAGATQDVVFNWTPVTDTCACVFTAEVDPDNTICECTNTNNIMAASSHTPDTADLTVQDIAFDNLVCASDGLTGTVGVTVRNSGCAPAAMVRVRLASDGCLTFDDRVVPLLNVGASTTVYMTPTLGWADCTDESCQFTATVDPLNTICEYDGSNNDRVETWSTTLPDLVVSAIDTSTIICSNDQIGGSVIVTVTNQGFGAATGFQVALETDGCLTFGAETVSATLGNGQSEALSFAVTGDLADCADTHCVMTATVDTTDAVCECDGSNNQLQDAYASATVDLAVNSVMPSSDCDTDAASGEVVVNVSNGGTSTATNAVVRLTSDCGHSMDRTVTLAAGANQNVTFNWTPVTASCTCVFTAEVDPDDVICECSGDNNSMGSSGHTPDIPDLRVAGDTITINCDDDGSLAAGGSLLVANDGCGAAFTADIPVRVTLYDLDDCAGDALAQWTATLSNVDIASQGTQSLLLPPEVLAVSAQAQGCAMSVEVELDPDNVICEYSGANNAYCANKGNPLPDLVIGEQDLTLECLGDSQARIQMNARVDNTGCSTVQGAVIISYTLHSGLGCAGPILGQWSRTAMLNVAADGSQWVQLIAEDLIGNLCDLADDCGLSLRAEIDVTDQVCEISGANNSHCADIAVEFPDLVVSAVTYDSSAPGQLLVDVANYGCGDATNVVVTVTADCGPIIQPQTVDLVANEERQLTFTFDPPTCDNCTCVFTAMIDGVSQICECTEDTNVRSSDQEPLRTEISISKTTPRSVAYVGETITYTLIVSNTGDATAGGIVISDELASGLEFVGPVTLEGSLGIVAQSAEDMPVLASGVTIRPQRRVTLTLPVRLTGFGPIRNVAVARAASGITPPTEDDEEILGLAIPTHMTGCEEPFCPGWTLRYSFWITNSLPYSLYDLEVWDELPEDVCCPSDVAWNSRPFEVSPDESRVTWTIPEMAAGEVIRLGVGLHTYPHLAHGSAITNTIRYYAAALGEERSETIVLHADTTICADPTPQPSPSPTPSPEPGPGVDALHIPLVLKD